MSQDIEVQAPPSDGVTCVRYAHTGNRNNLIVSSWDGSLRVYENESLRVKIDFDHPLLSCCYGGRDTEAFTGGLDCSISQIDLVTKKKNIFGKHHEAVRQVVYSHAYGLAISGSWDCHVKLWDIRNGANAMINNDKLDGKIFSMDVVGHILAVASSTRSIACYDIRNFAVPLYKKESPLKFQTRTVRIDPQMQMYAIGSIEGRVALEYLNEANKNYAFKCHREKHEGEMLVHPVNAIAFHPTYGTFATGGCDGIIHIWDGEKKKRISSLQKYPTSIASLDFNHDGSKLAIAVSYTYEQGEKDHPNDSIVLHGVQPSEVFPKQKQMQAS